MFRTTAIAAIAAFAFSGAALAQNNQGGGNQGQQEGLVNVQLGDVVISQIAQDINVDVSQIPVTVQVPVGVAANICGVDANILAQQKKDGDVSCEAESTSQALTQIVQREIGTTQQ
jgi:hypothetical protein